jgi:hypothetical protein
MIEETVYIYILSGMSVARLSLIRTCETGRPRVELTRSPLFLGLFMHGVGGF